MTATRLVVLGVVRSRGRAHGYLVHGESYSWGLEQWANVKWGSIYHALRKFAEDGKMVAHTLESPAGRVDYEITAEGEREFFRLLREALRKPDVRPDLLAVGLAFLTELTRQEALSLLRERLAVLEADRAGVAAWAGGPEGADRPGHVRELATLWTHSAESGAEWTRGLISRLEGGAYTMAGES